MRKSLFFAVLFSLFATIPAYAAETKVGVFYSRAVAAKCDAFIAAQKKMDSQFSGERKTLESLNDSLKKKASELQNPNPALSPEARSEKQDSFVRAKRDFEDRYQSVARKAEAAAMRIQREFETNLVKAAQNFGASAGYSLLLDANMGGPVYFDKSVDVTEDIIKEINKIYKAPR